MIDNLKAMALFVRTVELGSFRAAADSFGISPSVVSQQVSALERNHGVALLYRSTRKLSLTHEGEAFFTKACRMTEAAEHALTSLSVQPDARMGRLTLSVPNGLLDSPYMTAIAEFAETYPNVSISLLSGERQLDLIGSGIDLAIRAGRMSDSTLKARILGRIDRTLVAAPKLLKGRTLPKHPEELSNWPWVRLSMLPPRRVFERLSPDGKNVVDGVAVSYQAQVEVDNVHALHQLTREGVGISTPAAGMVAKDLIDGRLVQLIPDWRIAPLPVHAVWPPNVTKHGLTALLLDFLTERFG